MYGIQLESDEVVLLKTYGAGTIALYVEQSPIVSVISVTYSGSSLPHNLVDQTLTIDANSVTDTTIPIVVSLLAGYTNVPDDLKFAYYIDI